MYRHLHLRGHLFFCHRRLLITVPSSNSRISLCELFSIQIFVSRYSDPKHLRQLFTARRCSRTISAVSRYVCQFYSGYYLSPLFSMAFQFELNLLYATRYSSLSDVFKPLTQCCGYNEPLSLEHELLLLFLLFLLGHY